MTVALNELIEKLGNPGRLQIFVFFLLGFNYFPVVVNSLIMAVYGSRVPFYCADQGNDEHMSNWTNLTSYNVSDLPCDNETSNQCVCCRSAWVYNTTEVSMLTEWDLICGNQYLIGLSTSIFFTGTMVGGFLFGFLSDSIGRRPVVLITLYGQLLNGIAMFFAPDYTLFAVLRFIQGIFLQGLQTTSHTMLMEMFQPGHRTVVGVSLEIFWGTSYITLAGIWYLIQNWRYIQLAITLPTAVTIVYIWVLPESLRWLLLKKKFLKAEKLVKTLVKYNKLDYPEAAMIQVRLQVVAASDTKTNSYTVLDLVRTPTIRRRSLILSFTWFSASLVYVGLSLGATDLAGNKFLNLFISGAVEFPAYISSLIILKRFGRRRPKAAYFFACGLTCIGSGFISKKDTSLQHLSLALFMFGKYCTAGMYTVLFLFAAELYPTVVRAVGCGACAIFMKAGGLVAPLVLRLGSITFTQLPILIFGGFALVAGGLTLLLPETLNSKLPDKIEDVEIEPPGKTEETTADKLMETTFST
ncbi:organic cation transporter protein-like [Liolophura sinensis]|uniref:organic cation transporter protein-like n=1 Tax=Liolophura sinensis TaxID=3198878 RepID=UPI0031595138